MKMSDSMCVLCLDGQPGIVLALNLYELFTSTAPAA